ncbi:MAG: hypothetical protein P8X85_15765 [Desulfobacterales bacterium]
MNAYTKNQPRNVNSVTQTRFLMLVVRLAPACVLLGWAIGGLQGVLYALPGSAVAAFAVELLTSRVGSAPVNLL